MAKQTSKAKAKVEEVVEEPKTVEKVVEEPKTVEEVVETETKEAIEKIGKATDEAINESLKKDEVEHVQTQEATETSKETIEATTEEPGVEEPKTDEIQTPVEETDIQKVEEETIEHTVTAEDIKENPELTQEGVVEGDTIELEKPEPAQEGELETLLKNEHYFSFVSSGRHIADGNLTNENLKAFYEEFKLEGVLSTREHYRILEILKEKFNS